MHFSRDSKMLKETLANKLGGKRKPNGSGVARIFVKESGTWRVAGLARVPIGFPSSTADSHEARKESEPAGTYTGLEKGFGKSIRVGRRPRDITPWIF